MSYADLARDFYAARSGVSVGTLDDLKRAYYLSKGGDPLASTTSMEYAYIRSQVGGNLSGNDTKMRYYESLTGQTGLSLANQEMLFFQIPMVPTGLNSNTITQTTFNVTWNAAAGADNYEVFLDGVSYGTSPTSPKAVTGRTASTSYSVRVRAHGAGGWSALSNPIVVTTTA